MAIDGAHEVVEVVGDATSERTQRFESLRLRELLLEVETLGLSTFPRADVDERSLQNPVLGIEPRRSQARYHPTTLGQHPAFEIGHPTIGHQTADGDRALCGVGPARDRRAGQHLLACVSKDLCVFVVEIQDLGSVDGRPEHPHCGVVEKVSILLLALAKRLLHLLALAHVAYDGLVSAIAQQGAANLGEKYRSVFSTQLPFRDNLFAIGKRLVGNWMGGDILGHNHIGLTHVQQVFACVADKSACPRVDVDILSLFIGDEDRLGRLLDERAIAILAVTQGAK